MGERVEPAEQFDTLEQEQAAANLGMWLFLATEVLFIGALFAAYTVVRLDQNAAFVTGSHHNDVLLGTLNTAVLLTSSLTMALAVLAARVAASRLAGMLLAGTAGLGALFLGIKFYEYFKHWEHGFVPGLHFTYAGEHFQGVELFMWLYFATTGLHALHLLIGIAIVAVIAARGLKGRFQGGYHVPVEVTGLYWHFVDVVWIFLFPLFYLVR